MVRENQKYLNRLQIFLDIIIIPLAFSVAYYIKFSILKDGISGLSFQDHLIPILCALPIYLMVYNMFDLYSARRTKPLVIEISSIIKTNIIAVLAITLGLFLFKIIHFSREALFIFFILNSMGTASMRVFIRLFLKKYRSKGYNLKHCLVVGTTNSSITFIDKVHKNPHWGYNIVGVLKNYPTTSQNVAATPPSAVDLVAATTLAESHLDLANPAKSNLALSSLAKSHSNLMRFSESYLSSSPTDLASDPNLTHATTLDLVHTSKGKKVQETFLGYNVLGDIDLLDAILSKENDLDDQFDIDIVIIGVNGYDLIELGQILHACEKAGVKTNIIPYYHKYIPAKPYMDDLDGLPVIDTRHVPLDNMFKNLIKRTFDIVFSLSVIILLSPVYIFSALMVKLTSKGPIIYKQERIGLNRKSFHMYKFRSMRVQAKSDEQDKWTTKNDPRKTGWGSFMRKTSIDELPQFFNVLLGDMSVVGPRPERPYFVEKFKEDIPRYMIKHQVRPGITGWAQVNGYRGDTSIEGRIEHDLYYIENWTFSFDIKIIFLTVFKGFVNKNAY